VTIWHTNPKLKSTWWQFGIYILKSKVPGDNLAYKSLNHETVYLQSFNILFTQCTNFVHSILGKHCGNMLSGLWHWSCPLAILYGHKLVQVRSYFKSVSSIRSKHQTVVSLIFVLYPFQVSHFRPQYRYIHILQTWLTLWISTVNVESLLYIAFLKWQAIMFGMWLFVDREHCCLPQVSFNF